MEIGFNSGQFESLSSFLKMFFARIQLQINCFKKIFLRFDQHDLKLNFRMLILLYIMTMKVNCWKLQFTLLLTRKELLIIDYKKLYTFRWNSGRFEQGIIITTKKEKEKGRLCEMMFSVVYNLI